jgi:hypothetical protein
LKVAEDLLKRHDGEPNIVTKTTIMLTEVDLLRGHLSDCLPGSTPATTSSPVKRNPSRNEVKTRDSIQLDASELQDQSAEETVTDGMAMSFSDESASVFFGNREEESNLS